MRYWLIANGAHHFIICSATTREIAETLANRTMHVPSGKKLQITPLTEAGDAVTLVTSSTPFL